MLRSSFGLTPPEWAELARDEASVALNTSAARSLEGRCRADPRYCARLTPTRHAQVIARLDGLLAVAVSYLNQGAPAGSLTVAHRLDKVDTAAGLTSLQQAAILGVPYAMLLYERFLGRPFASYRDAVSELVGEVMESAIEWRLAAARDKTDRIQALAEMRDRRAAAGQPAFELVACIDGRDFGVRRADLRRTLLNTNGKVFTLATLDHLIANTRLRDFASRGI